MLRVAYRESKEKKIRLVVNLDKKKTQFIEAVTDTGIPVSDLFVVFVIAINILFY